MTWKANVLVVASKTADSDELLEALRARVARGPAEFMLVLPQNGTDRTSALVALEGALARMREAGLVVTGEVGDCDPLVAVGEAWDPGRFDEVIVSTLPTHSSRWLLIDLPHRVANLTGASVTHVVTFPRELTRS
jgi:GABA permease